jgi:hypothetical protein
MMTMIIVIIIIIQFFTYLRAELNSRWPITESTRIQIAATSQAQRQNKGGKIG